MAPEQDNSAPVEHHYVPRAYLAPFTRERTTRQGRLWVYTRGVREPVLLPLRGVAYERHLYTLPDADGNPSAALERHLARAVEAPFFKWRRRVITAPRGQAPGVLHSTSLTARLVIARYILYQHLRTPAQRQFAGLLAQLSTQFFWTDPAVRALCLHEYRLLYPERWRSLRDGIRELEFTAWMLSLRLQTDAILDAIPGRWLRPITRFVDALAPRLVQDLAWRLVELPIDVAAVTPLVTCDNPVILVRRAGQSEAPAHPGWGVILGAGWAEETLEMILPLSPRHALMIAADRTALALADDPMTFADAARVRTARHALQCVFARDPDVHITDILGQSRAPTVVYDVAGELVPASAGVQLVFRRVMVSGATHIGVHYTD